MNRRSTLRTALVTLTLPVLACAGVAAPESQPPIASDDGAPSEDAEPRLQRSEAEVATHALYTPKPDGARIGAAFAGASGVSEYNRTSFCIRKDGTTWNIRTLHSTGVLEADAIFRETIAAWRYRPITLDGEPRCVCTEIRFNLRRR